MPQAGAAGGAVPCLYLASGLPSGLVVLSLLVLERGGV